MKKNPASKMNDPVAGERNIAPKITLPRPGLSGWAIFAGAFFLGVLLFGVLEARRQAGSAPSIMTPSQSRFEFSDAPPLDIPADYGPPSGPKTAFRVQAEAQQPDPPRMLPVPPTQNYRSPEPLVVNPVENIPPVRTSQGSALVLDNSIAPPANAAQDLSKAAGPSGNTDRVRAARIANRSTTVPQGTLIKAVLETALNSTNPGFARAIVSRNVYGFDGSQILIPRGSRLIGEYRSEVSPGQNRALINWTRLIRPDGVTIAIGSPATDPVGRGGVRAKVDTHFFERFSAAIFQSALDIGVNVASRQADGTVIITPPNAQGASVAQTNQITPTLKVKPGASVSVFVARDLDFTDVDTIR